MTSNNQVSPVIRISRGERDASARATHLKAASKKYLETTIERKQMSTTTNFKRIALVAVAALGLGVLSSVPSQAAVNGLTVTVGNGEATVTSSTVVNDSGTAGTISITYLKTQAYDSVTVGLVLKSRPTDAAVITPTLMFDTRTVATTQVTRSNVITTTVAPRDTITSGVFVIQDTVVANADSKYTTASFKVILDTTAAEVSAGTYVVTAVVTPYDGSGTAATANAANTIVKDISFTITKPTSLSATADAATSTAIMNAGSTELTTLLDSTIAVSSVAGTAAAYVKVTLKNASGNAAQESVTVTIDKGVVKQVGGSAGRSIVITQTTGDAGITELQILADGTAGTATLTIKSTSVTFANKSVTFYSPTTGKITAGAYTSVIGATSTTAIYATEEDALGNKFNAGTEVWAYSSDTTTISNYGTACGAYSDVTKTVFCNLTGVKNGTANITLRNAATVAASTVVSNAVAMKVNVNPVASYKITADAASYAPGAKGTFIVKLYDKDGGVMPAGIYSNIFSSTGITTNYTMGAYVANESITATGWTTAANPFASASKTVVSLDPMALITYYLPTTPGTLVLSTTGGSGLPAAAQVAGTVNVSITDSGAAALAAVTALATTVASLRTLIVTLTNLVLKIQKKVRA